MTPAKPKTIAQPPTIEAEIPPEVALVPVPPQPLAVARDPDAVLSEAIRAAEALKRVLDAKPRPVILNGERYLEYEDWQTIARFYGVTAMVRETHFVEYGDIQGFEAVAEALLVSTNQVISCAEAACLNDEPKWATRAKYEWVKGHDGRNHRAKVGEEPVPLFQLRSMAQTRACAKVLRNVLAWVVVLAGYRPTPAEEISDIAASDKQAELSADVCRDCGFDIQTKEEKEAALRRWGKVVCKVCGKKYETDQEHKLVTSLEESVAAQNKKNGKAISV